ncbi:hypothetical protein J6590_057435 [Homalodisca vitripennis]|nr:hypothetical protein J6590_057435 [Homalodisca vitripennis]
MDTQLAKLLRTRHTFRVQSAEEKHFRAQIASYRSIDPSYLVNRTAVRQSFIVSRLCALIHSSVGQHTVSSIAGTYINTVQRRVTHVVYCCFQENFSITGYCMLSFARAAFYCCFRSLRTGPEGCLLCILQSSTTHSITKNKQKVGINSVENLRRLDRQGWQRQVRGVNNTNWINPDREESIVSPTQGTGMPERATTHPRQKTAHACRALVNDSGLRQIAPVIISTATLPCPVRQQLIIVSCCGCDQLGLYGICQLLHLTVKKEPRL